MTDRSTRFRMPFLQSGQAQKEIFHNEALVAIDCALHPCIEGRAIADPPADPQIGESWIVGEDASAAWAGFENALATWTPGGWRFTFPLPGMAVWNKADGLWAYWTGTIWTMGILPAAAIEIGGVQVVGPRLPEVANPAGGATVDSEARAAIGALIATLKSHGLTD